jgi:hypothetical protein
LSEERRLTVFENRVLRKIFGPERDEVKEKLRTLHNEELVDLCSSLIIIRMIKSRRMRLAGHLIRMRERRDVCTVTVGKPVGKRTLGRPRFRWEDNIKIELREVGCGGMDWIELAEDREKWRTLVNGVMNLRIP